MGRDRDNRDSKYCRLTGLWESKKRGLFSGKLREQDLEKLQEKVDEAKDAGADLVFFLWENNDKRGRKDPDFTLQVAVAEDNGGRSSSRGRSGGGYGRGRDRDDRDDERDRGRDRDRGREEEDEPDEKEEEQEQEEEKPRSRKSAPAKKSTASKGKSTKKKDDDW